MAEPYVSMLRIHRMTTMLLIVAVAMLASAAIAGSATTDSSSSATSSPMYDPLPTTKTAPVSAPDPTYPSMGPLYLDADTLDAIGQNVFRIGFLPIDEDSPGFALRDRLMDAGAAPYSVLMLDEVVNFVPRDGDAGGDDDDCPDSYHDRGGCRARYVERFNAAVDMLRARGVIIFSDLLTLERCEELYGPACGQNFRLRPGMEEGEDESLKWLEEQKRTQASDEQEVMLFDPVEMSN